MATILIFTWHATQTVLKYHKKRTTSEPFAETKTTALSCFGNCATDLASKDKKLKLKASYKIRSIYFIKEILMKKTKFTPFTFCYVDLKCLSINFSFSERTVILGRAFPSHVFFYLSPSNRIHCYEKQNYSFNLLLKFRTEN